MTCLPLTTDRVVIESLPKNWATAEITFKHTDGRLDTRYEILDMIGGGAHIRYHHEPMAITAFKCFMLAIVGVPLYGFIYLGAHLIRLPVITLSNLSPRIFFKQVWTIVRAPFYLISLQFAAIYGIFKPLAGKSLLGGISVLFHNRSHRDDIRNADLEPDPCQTIWKFLTDENHRHTFMAAVCMVPTGKTNDPHITGWRVINPLS